jgi:hypothetical protein
MIRIYWVFAIIIMLIVYVKYNASTACMTGLSCILLDKIINQNKDG